MRSDVNDRYGPDVYVEQLVDFMRDNRDKPFFAFYSMALAHDVTDDVGTPPPLGPQGHYDSYKRMVENMDERVAGSSMRSKSLAFGSARFSCSRRTTGHPSRTTSLPQAGRCSSSPLSSFGTGRRSRAAKANSPMEAPVCRWSQTGLASSRPGRSLTTWSTSATVSDFRRLGGRDRA